MLAPQLAPQPSCRWHRLAQLEWRQLIMIMTELKLDLVRDELSTTLDESADRSIINM